MVSIYDIEAHTLWGLFIGSAVLTIPAVAKRSVSLLLIGAVMSFIRSFFGMMTLGIWMVLLTFTQLTMAMGFMVKARWVTWILLAVAAMVAWFAVFLYVGNPLGLKQI
jgi:hypothetical protein